jgi:hypothetical protein
LDHGWAFYFYKRNKRGKDVGLDRFVLLMWFLVFGFVFRVLGSFCEKTGYSFGVETFRFVGIHLCRRVSTVVVPRQWLNQFWFWFWG